MSWQRLCANPQAIGVDPTATTRQTANAACAKNWRRFRAKRRWCGNPEVPFRSRTVRCLSAHVASSLLRDAFSSQVSYAGRSA